MAEGSTTTRAIRAPGIPTKRRRPDPDANLISWCGRFDELERQYKATCADLAGPDTTLEEIAEDAKRDAITDQQRPLLDKIVRARATTAAGHRARAASLHLWDAPGLKTDGGPAGSFPDRLLWALVRDLIRSPAP